MPILDDVNGPMRPGAGYINMNIAADGTRVSAVRAFLRPALSRPNLTLLVNTNVVKLNFKGTFLKSAGVGAANWFTTIGMKHARVLQQLQAAVVL